MAIAIAEETSIDEVQSQHELKEKAGLFNSLIDLTYLAKLAEELSGDLAMPKTIADLERIELWKPVVLQMLASELAQAILPEKHLDTGNHQMLWVGCAAALGPDVEIEEVQVLMYGDEILSYPKDFAVIENGEQKFGLVRPSAFDLEYQKFPLASEQTLEQFGHLAPIVAQAFIQKTDPQFEAMDLELEINNQSKVLPMPRANWLQIQPPKRLSRNDPRVQGRFRGQDGHKQRRIATGNIDPIIRNLVRLSRNVPVAPTDSTNQALVAQYYKALRSHSDRVAAVLPAGTALFYGTGEDRTVFWVAALEPKTGKTPVHKLVVGTTVIGGGSNVKAFGNNVFFAGTHSTPSSLNHGSLTLGIQDKEIAIYRLLAKDLPNRFIDVMRESEKQAQRRVARVNKHRRAIAESANSFEAITA